MAAGLEFEEALELKKRRQGRANTNTKDDSSPSRRKSRRTTTEDKDGIGSGLGSGSAVAADNRLMRLLWRSHRASPAPHVSSPESVQEGEEESHSDDSESHSHTRSRPISPSSPASPVPPSSSPSPPRQIQNQNQNRTGSETGLISSFYQTLRRAHLNAVRLQTLEWLSVRRERGWRVWMRGQTLPSVRSSDEIEMRCMGGGVEGGGGRDGKGKGVGEGVSWWGPVGKWRLKDRTRY